MTIHESHHLPGQMPLAAKRFDPLQDFEFAPYTPDKAASAGLHERHIAICEKLRAIHEGHGQLDRDRIALQDAIIKRFEVVNLEAIKQIPWKRFQLFQDEVVVRLELENWFRDYRSEVAALIADARKAMLEAGDDVRASILALGYDKEKVSHHLHHGKVGPDGSGEHDSLVLEHPTVKAAAERAHILRNIHDDLNLALDTNRRRSKTRGAVVEQLMERMLAKAIDHADSL